MPQNEKLTILVVDDEPDLRDIFRDELEQNGYRVLVAENGIVAWDLFQKEKVDGIISDIRMPGGGGLQLLERVRLKNAKIPVILVSGFSDVEMAGANRRGATFLFSKPVDLNQLVQTLKESLANQKSDPF